MSSADHDPLDAVAEAFLARYRRGERPSLTEYVRQHPDLADRIRALFPTLVALEHLDAGPGVPARRPNPRAPDQLGEYRLLREIGRGGMGVVYEAVQESLDRRVALKVLPFNDLIDPRHLERFRREARAAAGLHHTNIVPVFGVGEHAGVHFYAMQFIHGQGLDAVIREVKRLRDDDRTPRPTTAATLVGGEASVAERLHAGKFTGPPTAPAPQATAAYSPSAPPAPPLLPGPEPGPDSNPETALAANRSELTDQPQAQYYRSVARLGVQAAEALDYAHRHGVLHRDVKPGNLLLDTEGTLWVTDFGLAKAEGSEDLTNTGDLVGTLRYMAPERVRGAADPRSDVYSLGVTLYELLALRPAFDAADRVALLDQVRDREPPPPRKLDPAIPRDLETVVLKAMAKDPARRYPTAAALAEDLQQFLGARPIRARRVGPAERVWRWCRRNPVVAALSASLLLALLLGLAGVGWKWSEAEEAHQDASRRAEAEAAQRRRAEEAELGAVDRLWGSYRDQARAGISSRRAGQRFAALEALEKAARIARERRLPPERLHELRDLASACLALPDLRVAREWEGFPPGSIAVDFDGNLEIYVRCDRQGEVSVRLVADDRLLQSLPNRGRLVIPKFSPDGRTLALWDTGDFSLRVWHLTDAKPQLVLEEVAVVPNAYDFRPDSKQFAVTRTDGTVRVIDLKTGQLAHQLQCSPAPIYVAFHPARQELALACGTSARVWDLAGGNKLHDFQHPAAVFSVAWHPSGRSLAAGCHDYRIHLWDVETGQQTLEMEGLKSHGCVVAFNHAGSLLVSTEWGRVLRLWSPQTGRQLFSLPAEALLAPLRFGPDDRLLACSAQGTRIQLWQVSPGRARRTLLHKPAVAPAFNHCAVSPVNSRLLAAAVEDGLRFWDLKDGSAVGLLRSGGFPTCVAFDGSGNLYCNGPAGPQRWPVWADAAAGDIRFGPPEKLPGLNRPYLQVSVSQDGEVIAGAQFDGGLVLHRSSPEPPVRLAPHDDVRFIAVSVDGRWVATGSHGATKVKVWDAASGRLAKELPVESGAQVGFSPDGRWLATHGEGCRLWRVGTWKPGPLLDPGRNQAFAFSPLNGLVAVETGRGVVRLLDAATGREVARLEDPDGDRASDLCFSPDGCSLVVNVERHALHVWDLRALRVELAVLGLDWDWPAFPPALRAESVSPLRVDSAPPKKS